MPRFFFTIDDSENVENDADGVDLPDAAAAKDAAQVEVADIAKEHLPDGARADFSVRVNDEAGDEIYRASLVFKGEQPETAAERQERERSDCEAADAVAMGFRGLD